MEIWMKSMKDMLSEKYIQYIDKWNNVNGHKKVDINNLIKYDDRYLKIDDIEDYEGLRTLGICEEIEEGKYSITISREIINHFSQRCIIDLALHELAHFVCSEVYDDESHGENFRYICNFFGVINNESSISFY